MYLSSQHSASKRYQTVLRHAELCTKPEVLSQWHGRKIPWAKLAFQPSFPISQQAQLFLKCKLLIWKYLARRRLYTGERQAFTCSERAQGRMPLCSVCQQKKCPRIINSASGFHTLSDIMMEVSTVQLLEMGLGGRSTCTCNNSLWKLLGKLMVASTGFGASLK